MHIYQCLEADNLKVVCRNLRNNRFNGTLDMGKEFSSQLQTVDLQNNFISEIVAGIGYSNKLL